MDKSRIVKLQHLRAALEVWRFCEESARFIFSKRSAVTIEAKMIKMLRSSPDGLRQSEISERFSHHLTSDEINHALRNLRDQGSVRAQTVKTPGRPANRWYAIRHKSDKAD
jgi:hypothetical protein